MHDLALDNRDKGAAETWLKAVGVMQSHSQRDLSLWENVTEDSLDALSEDALIALRAAKELELQERERMASARERLGNV